jgi:DNA-binding PadR family transcriptional regulator
MKTKGWRNESERHKLSAYGIKTKKEYLNFQIWKDKSLSSSYLMLEILSKHGPQFQQKLYNDLDYFDVSRVALGNSISRLENKGLIKITKEIAPSGRLSYLLTITKKGHDEFKVAQKKWLETVSKNVIIEEVKL